MPQTVWIARHGNRLDFVNPEWFNTAERRYDPPLSDDGVVQAQELAARLKNEAITQIFVSPFLRTIQTANEVAQVLDLPLKLEWGFCEWLNPQWMTAMPETHPQEWLAERYPLIDWSYQSWLKPQYPETETELNIRTAQTIQHLVKTYSENILVVGHGGSVFGTTQGLVPNIERFRVSLCSLTKLVKEKSNYEWQTELLADISHLSSSQQQFRLN